MRHHSHRNLAIKTHDNWWLSALMQSYLMMKCHYWIPSLAHHTLQTLPLLLHWPACSCAAPPLRESWMKLYVIKHNNAIRMIQQRQTWSFVRFSLSFSLIEWSLSDDEHERFVDMTSGTCIYALGGRRQDVWVWISNCVRTGDVIKQSNTLTRCVYGHIQREYIKMS